MESKFEKLRNACKKYPEFELKTSYPNKGKFEAEERFWDRLSLNQAEKEIVKKYKMKYPKK